MEVNTKISVYQRRFNRLLTHRTQIEKLTFRALALRQMDKMNLLGQL